MYHSPGALGYPDLLDFDLHHSLHEVETKPGSILGTVLDQPPGLNETVIHVGDPDQRTH